MIEKRTRFNQIEVVELGHLQIRFSIDFVENGIIVGHRAEEEGGRWHRTSAECGSDLDAQLAAVNAHLAAINCAPISVGDHVRIKAIADADWTPQRKTAWQLQVEKNKLVKG